MEHHGKSSATQQFLDASQGSARGSADMLMIVPATVPAGLQEWHDRPAPLATAPVPRSWRRVLIRVVDADGAPVPGAEVSFLGDHDLHGDSARADAQGHAVLTVAPSDADALLVEASGYAPFLQPAPDTVCLLPGRPVANTVTLQPVWGRGPGALADAPCWGVEAMQIDCATLGMPLGTRRARVGILGTSEPGSAAGTPSADMLAIHEIIERICTDTDTVFHALPPSPSLSQTVHALGALAERGTDLILLTVLPSAIAPQLEDCMGQLRRKGILVLSPASESCHGAGCWSRTAPVLCVGSLRRQARQIAACPRPAAARVDLLAPGAGIRVGQSLRSGALLAAAHAAGFLVCVMQVEGLLVGQGRRPVADQLLPTLNRWTRPVGTGAGMPVWGGQDFYEIAE
jgi:hypothetical protein